MLQQRYRKGFLKKLYVTVSKWCHHLTEAHKAASEIEKIFQNQKLMGRHLGLHEFGYTSYASHERAVPALNGVKGPLSRLWRLFSFDWSSPA